MANWSRIEVTDNVSIFDKQKYDNFSAGIEEALENIDSLNISLQNMGANLEEVTEDLEESISNKIDGGYVDDGVLYLTSNGEIITIIELPTGSGEGGGTDSGSEVTITNTSGWISKDIPLSDETTNVSFTWSSLENEIATGNGIITVFVGGKQVLAKSVTQGSNTINVRPYLQKGSNTLRFVISDIYGKSKLFQVSVNVIELSISSSFDWTQRFTTSNDISLTYVPVGSVSKNVVITVNDTEVIDVDITTSNRAVVATIPSSSLTTGLNTIVVSMSAVINEQTLTVPPLTYNVYVSNGNTKYVIANEDKNNLTVSQFSSVTIPYIAYNPENLRSNIVVTYNGTQIANTSVGREKQSITIRFDSFNTSNKAVIKFINDTFIYTITYTVNASQLPITAKTEGLDFALLSTGRSNSEENKDEWTNNGKTCTFTGVDFGSIDGWVQDKNGDIALKLMNGGKCVVNTDPFLQDAKQTGKAFEVEFCVDDCENRDEVIIECKNPNGVGIEITCDTIRFKSEQIEMKQTFYPSSKVRFSFVVEGTSENRLIFIFMNGVMCGVQQYAQGDSFSHATSYPLTLKTNKCSLYVYAIRHYTISLTHDEILDNYIADRGNMQDVLSLYQSNNICDQYGEISPEKLPASVPYLVLTGAELPQAKKDKKLVDMQFVYPLDETRNWTCHNGQIDVQGSSSQFYRRKNFTIEPNYSGDWKDNANRLITGWGFYKEDENDYYVPTDSFVIKVDVASSEGYNNSELVDIFEDGSRWKTNKQREGKGYRQTIKSFPIFLFWDDGTETTFYGKANLGTGKGSYDVYGYEDGDQQISLENNTSELTNFMTDSFANADVDLSWEYGEEEGYTEAMRFWAFVNSCNPDKATNQTIPAITYNGVRYTKDSVAFRNARFKALLSTYCPVEQVLFYFLWCEQFLMTDSLSKNCQWNVRNNPDE